MSKIEYPYEWTCEAMPSGKKGWRCRIVGGSKKERSQGLVLVRFAREEKGPDYLVRMKGLKRI